MSAHTIRRTVMLTLSVILLVTLGGCACKHEWQDATCLTPNTCALCNETEGDPLAHEWKGATCLAPKTCALCGEITGKTLSHQWQDATCSAPETCALCGETSGEPLLHQWEEADCLKPKTCILCGATDGSKLSAHTLDSAGKCTACAAQIGFSLNLSTVNDYLSIKGKDEGVKYKDKYNIPQAVVAFTVEPLKNVEFHDVALTFHVTVWETGSNPEFFAPGEKDITVYLSETGYATTEGMIAGAHNARQINGHDESIYVKAQWSLSGIKGYIVE